MTLAQQGDINNQSQEQEQQNQEFLMNERPQNQDQFDKDSSLKYNSLSDSQLDNGNLDNNFQEEIVIGDNMESSNLNEVGAVEVLAQEQEEVIAKNSGELDHKKIKEHAQEIHQLEGNVDNQIDKIIQIARLEGPYYAIKVAKKVEDMQGSNYLIDEVQENLMKMRDEFTQKGFLKNIQ